MLLRRVRPFAHGRMLIVTPLRILPSNSFRNVSSTASTSTSTTSALADIDTMLTEICTYDRAESTFPMEAIDKHLHRLVVIHKEHPSMNVEYLCKSLACLQNSLIQDEYVTDVFEEVIPKLETNLETFVCKNLVHAFTGIRYFEIDEYLTDLLIALKWKVNKMESISAETISYAYNGLQSMSGKEASVRTLLVELNRKFRNSPSTSATSEDFGRIFMGIQNMTTREDEVKDLVGVLGKKIKESSIKDFSDISESAFLGLYHLNRKDSSVKTLLSELKKRHCDVVGDEL